MEEKQRTFQSMGETISRTLKEREINIL